MPISNSFSRCEVDSFLIVELNELADEQGTPRFRNMYDIYEKFVLSGDYGYELAYKITEGIAVIGLGFSTARCTDCSLSGEVEPPAFWEEKQY